MRLSAPCEGHRGYRLFVPAAVMGAMLACARWASAGGTAGTPAPLGTSLPVSVAAILAACSLSFLLGTCVMYLIISRKPYARVDELRTWKNQYQEFEKQQASVLTKSDQQLQELLAENQRLEYSYIQQGDRTVEMEHRIREFDATLLRSEADLQSLRASLRSLASLAEPLIAVSPLVQSFIERHTERDPANADRVAQAYRRFTQGLAGLREWHKRNAGAAEPDVDGFAGLIAGLLRGVASLPSQTAGRGEGIG